MGRAPRTSGPVVANNIHEDARFVTNLFGSVQPRTSCNTPWPRHSNAMKTTVELDASNRIVLSRELRQAAGIPRRQKLIVSATPGRIVLELEPNVSGRIIKRGKLKIWTGDVPVTPIQEAVEQSRHYTR